MEAAKPTAQEVRERLLAELERLRRTLPPEQYGHASARIIHRLNQLGGRPRYALT